MRISHLLLFLFTICLSVVCHGQKNRKIDSLLILLKEHQIDSEKVNILNLISNEFKSVGDYENTILYGNKALQIASNINFTYGVIGAYNNIGNALSNKGEYKKALSYYFKCITTSESLLTKNRRVKISLGTTYNNIGLVYDYTGDFENSIKYYLNAIRIYETLNSKQKLADTYNNIGVVNWVYGNYEKALEYYFKSLKFYEEMMNDPTENNEVGRNGTAASYSNIGLIYDDKGDYENALKYYNKGLVIYEKLGDKQRIAGLYNNIGLILANTGETNPNPIMRTELINQAIEYCLKSLKLRTQIEELEGIATSSLNLGNLYVALKEYDKARSYLNEGLKISKKINSKEAMKDCYSGLAVLDSASGNWQSAFRYYKLYSQTKDSIFNEENSRQMAEMQTIYESEKKDSEIKLLNKDKEIAAAKNKKQRTILLFTLVGLMLVIFFSIFIWRTLQITRKQKAIIETQKQEVEHQKEIVEEKNQEILDSITYAKRLQDAILPPLKLVKQNLENSFILYKPKDIVAGDFYWMELAPPNLPKGEVNYSPPLGELEEAILFAAADCTGHGVPGAMVSVVCSNALNRSVKEFGITEPGKILDKVTDLVIETFEKSEAEVKDGMDISLVSLAYKTESDNGERKAILKWAGANNPLWVVRCHSERSDSKAKNLNYQERDASFVSMTKEDKSNYSLFTTNYSLFEFKADKQPIGKYSDRSPFSTHIIELYKNDSIYIFTDGYADQFGGEKGKKFKSSKLKELILSIQNESMDKQKELINDAFETWKGSLEQVDDVCIIGFRI